MPWGRFLVKPSLIISYVAAKVKNQNLRPDVIRLPLQMSRFWSLLQGHSAITVLTWFLQPAKEVWGKVIFLHLSVILFTRGRCLPLGQGYLSHGPEGVCVCTPPDTQPLDVPRHTPPGHTPLDTPPGCTPWTHPLLDTHPSRSISGWYASYWNAFLFSGISYQNFLSIKLF